MHSLLGAGPLEPAQEKECTGLQEEARPSLSACLWGGGQVLRNGNEGSGRPSMSRSWPPSSQVYIIGHVPPGFFEKTRNKAWFREVFNEKYLKVIQKHHRVIAGQFFGHHHTDTFRMFYDDAGNQPGGRLPAGRPPPPVSLPQSCCLSPGRCSHQCHVPDTRGHPVENHITWSSQRGQQSRHPGVRIRPSHTEPAGQKPRVCGGLGRREGRELNASPHSLFPN